MKKLITIFALITMIYSCGKDETFGDKSIILSVSYQDNINEDGIEKPLDSQLVVLREFGSANFLYTAITDEDGQIEFDLLVGDRKYEVYAEKTINGLPFSDTTVFTQKDQTRPLLKLIPDESKFNGININLTDSAGAGIPGVSICLYLSSILADSANCSTSTLSGTTDEFGQFLLVNIPSRTYHLNVVDTIQNIPISVRETIEVQAKGMNKLNLIAF